MDPQLVFVIGAQRSGTTLLERIMNSHSMILGGAEPHILTPLAYLGFWRKVDRAPYDTIVSALGQQAFVQNLPNGEEDYWNACRAYCDLLYAQHLSGSEKRICLDKTPEYATVLPFINKVYPDAKYIVLSRHPAAIFSSFANSFFDGNYSLAQKHEPLLERYIPPIAAFLRQTEIDFLHIRYEELVINPESEIRRVYDHLGVPHEPDSLNYVGHEKRSGGRVQLGDPLGVDRFKAPSSSSLTTWADELKRNNTDYDFMRGIINRLDPRDLETFGYPIETLWQAMETPDSGSKHAAPLKVTLNRYRMERKLIINSRALVRRYSWLANLVRRVRLACDVLLRDM